MKLILLAATAALAMPGILAAQTVQTAPDQAAPAPADPAAAAPPAAPMQAAPDAAAQPDTAQQPMTTGTAAGGYQPSGPAMQGTMTPGVQPTYQPAASPSQAYPAPAPKASYPICKKGQYDGCMERGGKK